MGIEMKHHKVCKNSHLFSCCMKHLKEYEKMVREAGEKKGRESVKHTTKCHDFQQKEEMKKLFELEKMHQELLRSKIEEARSQAFDECIEILNTDSWIGNNESVFDRLLEKLKQRRDGKLK